MSSWSRARLRHRDGVLVFGMSGARSISAMLADMKYATWGRYQEGVVRPGNCSTEPQDHSNHYKRPLLRTEDAMEHST